MTRNFAICAIYNLFFKGDTKKEGSVGKTRKK
jgi:hypothetical protein